MSKKNDIVNVLYECRGFLQRGAVETAGEDGEKIKLAPYAEMTCYCGHCLSKKEIHTMTRGEYEGNGSFSKICPNKVISRGRKAFYIAEKILT